MRAKTALWALPIVLSITAAAGLYPKILRPSTLAIDLDGTTMPADGRSTLVFSADGPRAAVRMISGERRVRIETVRSVGNRTEITVRAGVQPGSAELEISAAGFNPARAAFLTVADNTDSFGDGTPDFLRLDAGDQGAFRSGFTLLAEAAYYQPPDRLPAEISDCAALLRFAYREALRRHDGTWASELAMDILPTSPAIAKYEYPFTPLSAGIFRIKSGAYLPSDASDGTFAQFADAETIRRRNTRLISRDFRAAQPGDLLFYRQLEPDASYHSMIFVGPSQFEADSRLWVVYHTGPTGTNKGEMRKLAAEELQNHREPRWHPVLANNNFLGVYRWNILR